MKPPPRRRARAAAALAAALLAGGLLGGCASRAPLRDGPGPHPPPGLERLPDAQPRIEPLRTGGPNKPYDYGGQRYVPMTADLAYAESGGASWYGARFHGLPTASGEPYDMYAMTAAHRTLPIPSYARVRNPANGREVIVRINDRGPFASGRIIDLSYAAALKLGVLSGVAPVQVQRITQAEIRAGSYGPGVAPAPAPAMAPDDGVPGDAGPPVTVTAGWWLQLGAFRTRAGAAQLQQRVLAQPDAALPGVAVFDEASWFRVQAGPWATRAEALDASDRLQRLLGLAALVVQRADAPR